MSNKVEVPVNEYSQMLPHWRLTTALWGGTPAMRKAASVYLPQEPAEPMPAYEIRIARSVLTNFYKQTVTRLVGKVFKQAITQRDDIPAQVKALLTNIDNIGTDLDRFSQDVLSYAINDGVAHILIDAPSAEGLPVDPVLGQPSLAAERAAGLRPYAVIVNAESLIGWKSEMVAGKRVLTQVRIYSCQFEQDPDTEFGQIKVERVQVIEPRLKRTYKKGPKDNDYVLEDTKVTTWDAIPLVTLYTNRHAFMVGEPMLLDLAYLNVAHWQSDSDQRNILHVARVPILFGAGLGEDDDNGAFELKIGPNSVTRGPQGSTLTYVEHGGKAIDAGVKDLESLEQRMATIGLDMITRRTGNTTATARALDQHEVDSPLQTVAKALEDALNKVLDVFALWFKLGEDKGGTVEVFKDFGISSRDAEDLKTLLAMRDKGDISRETFWAELKRRGLLSDDFDPETEMDLLEVESTQALDAAVRTAQAMGELTTGDQNGDGKRGPAGRADQSGAPDSSGNGGPQ
jgi:hypothetical protein